MSASQTFQQLQEIHKNGKLAGSWLICGEKGVGKHTAVRQFIHFLMGTDDSVVFHPDVKWITRDYTDKEKKEIIKTLQEGRALDEQADRARKAEITVDDIAQGLMFLGLTSAQNQWRVLVIDTAEDMNTNAANSLLKRLEEPTPQTVIFLISHNKGKLLPTIRSRCRTLTVAPATDKEIVDFLNTFDLSFDDKAFVVRLAKGSFGVAQDLAACDASALYSEMLDLLTAQPFHDADVISFCSRMLADETKTTVLQTLISHYFSEHVPQAQQPRAWLDLWDNFQSTQRDIVNLNLEKKDVFVDFFCQLGRLR